MAQQLCLGVLYTFPAFHTHTPTPGLPSEGDVGKARGMAATVIRGATY